jgi:hypothetical protein
MKIVEVRKTGNIKADYSTQAYRKEKSGKNSEEMA